jgi:surfactin synthase thioesterase subunit
VQLPGRENRISEPVPLAVRELAAQATEALKPMFDQKFALFGHSLGALVAYEIARNLQRAGQRMPERLIASGHRAPTVLCPHKPTWDLPDSEFRKRVSELNGTPKEVFDHPELLQLVIPLLRADFRLDECYTCDPRHTPLTCPITAFGGCNDSDVSEADLKSWSEMTSCGFEYAMNDGDHFFIHSEFDWLVRSVRQALRARGHRR